MRTLLEQNNSITSISSKKEELNNLQIINSTPIGEIESKEDSGLSLNNIQIVTSFKLSNSKTDTSYISETEKNQPIFTPNKVYDFNAHISKIRTSNINLLFKMAIP